MSEQQTCSSPGSVRCRLESARAAWRAVIRATGPVDRDEAERRIRALYACAGQASSRRPAVPRIIWVPSPLAGFRAADLLVNATVLQVIQHTPASPGLQAVPAWQRDVVAAVPDLDERMQTVLLSEAFASVLANVADYPTDTPEDRQAITDAIFLSVDEDARQLCADVSDDDVGPPASLRLAMDPMLEHALAASATLDSPWARRERSLYEHGWGYLYHGLHTWSDETLIALDALRPRGFPEHEPPWRLALDILRVCPFWWAFNGVAIACERPSRLSLDDADRLHAADGPAAIFADGFTVYAWHGTVMTEQIIRTMPHGWRTAVT